MIVNSGVLKSSLDRWFRMRTIRIEADPELIKLGNRIMDFLEGSTQKKIDEIAAAVSKASDSLKASTDDLKTVLPKEKQ